MGGPHATFVFGFAQHTLPAGTKRPARVHISEGRSCRTVGELLYKPDIDEARERLSTWWNGGDIGRPALQMIVVRDEPAEVIPTRPEPEGWGGRYSTRDLDYSVYLAQRTCARLHYLAEAVPTAAPDLGPGCLALYLGCTCIEANETVWFEPCIERPEEARFVYDRENFYWDFTLRFTDELLRVGRGRFLLSFPDLIEGLDTLAAMRAPELLLMDLLERPEWVRCSLRRITDRYFHYYDILYDRMRDEVGGSNFWAWAPGRMAKLQCDFSAMISPAMFRDFMVPVLTEMCERLSYTMYHWDGPGALCHHDALLSIPGLDMLQWTPGAGEEPTWGRKWWRYYHKSIEAGKKLLIDCNDVETMEELKREFGAKLKQFLIRGFPRSVREANQVMAAAEV